MIKINHNLTLEDMKEGLKKLWILSGEKIMTIENEFDFSKGSPVFTIRGKYSTRGWTEWTLGFHYGSAILHYEISGEKEFLDIARLGTLGKMATHISHTGVHDHGFNILSTYGNLLRLMNRGLLPPNEWEKRYYELALKISGAIQATRWTELTNGGYIYSFNGPHSLFIDSIRSVRSLAVSHLLGHMLFGEDDVKINLLERAISHLQTTARYSVYYGKNRDQYDVPGRIAHECVFNIKNGSYRNPSSQQGYSARTTWMRGLAWAILGFAEELELIAHLSEGKQNLLGNQDELKVILLRAACVTADYYIDQTPTDGIPYWDSGAPGLNPIIDYQHNPADPFNSFEPIDSSAAVIAAQGFLRLGRYLNSTGQKENGKKYCQAGLTIFNTLLSETYLCEDRRHQGLVLHSIYHYPNGWDYKPERDKVPYGESSMWGDYHMRELGMFIHHLLNSGYEYKFFDCVK